MISVWKCVIIDPYKTCPAKAGLEIGLEKVGVDEASHKMEIYIGNRALHHPGIRNLLEPF